MSVSVTDIVVFAFKFKFHGQVLTTFCKHFIIPLQYSFVLQIKIYHRSDGKEIAPKSNVSFIGSCLPWSHIGLIKLETSMIADETLSRV